MATRTTLYSNFINQFKKDPRYNLLTDDEKRIIDEESKKLYSELADFEGNFKVVDGAPTTSAGSFDLERNKKPVVKTPEEIEAAKPLLTKIGESFSGDRPWTETLKAVPWDIVSGAGEAIAEGAKSVARIPHATAGLVYDVKGRLQNIIGDEAGAKESHLISQGLSDQAQEMAPNKAGDSMLSPAYWAGVVPEAIGPSLIASLLPGAGLAKAGKALKVGAEGLKWLQRLGTFGGMTAQEDAGIGAEMFRKTGDIASMKETLPYSVPAAFIDVVGGGETGALAGLLDDTGKALKKGITKEAVEKAAKEAAEDATFRVGKDIIKPFVSEAAQESTQTAFEKAALEAKADPGAGYLRTLGRAVANNPREIFEAGIAGGITGPIFRHAERQGQQIEAEQAKLIADSLPGSPKEQQVKAQEALDAAQKMFEEAAKANDLDGMTRAMDASTAAQEELKRANDAIAAILPKTILPTVDELDEKLLRGMYAAEAKQKNDAIRNAMAGLNELAKKREAEIKADPSKTPAPQVVIPPAPPADFRPGPNAFTPKTERIHTPEVVAGFQLLEEATGKTKKADAAKTQFSVLSPAIQKGASDLFAEVLSATRTLKDLHKKTLAGEDAADLEATFANFSQNAKQIAASRVPAPNPADIAIARAKAEAKAKPQAPTTPAQPAITPQQPPSSVQPQAPAPGTQPAQPQAPMTPKMTIEKLVPSGNVRIGGTGGEEYNPMRASGANAKDLSQPIRPIARPAQSPAMPKAKLGTQAKAITPKNREIGVQYAVVEAADLITSDHQNYHHELQPRNRDKSASQTQIASIAARPIPERLITNHVDADVGTPIIGSDMMVESGNGRTIGLRTAYQNGTAGGYRNYLISNASAFGINPADVQGMSQPILVRVRQGEMSLEARRELAKELNLDTKLQMSASEQAVADADAVFSLINSLTVSESGDIFTTGNLPFLRGFFGKVATRGDEGRYMDDNGQITQDGADRVMRAVFSAAYGNPRLTALYADSTDVNVRTVMNALVRAMPLQLKVRDGVKKGTLHPLDITENIAEAAVKLNDLRAAGESVQDFMAQGILIGEPMPPLSKDLLIIFDMLKSAPKIAGVIDGHNTAILKIGNPKQGSLEKVEIPSKANIVLGAVRTIEEKENVQPDLFADKREDGQKGDGPVARRLTERREKDAVTAPGTPDRPAGGDRGQGAETQNADRPVTPEPAKQLNPKINDRIRFMVNGEEFTGKIVDSNKQDEGWFAVIRDGRADSEGVRIGQIVEILKPNSKEIDALNNLGKPEKQDGGRHTVVNQGGMWFIKNPAGAVIKDFMYSSEEQAKAKAAMLDLAPNDDENENTETDQLEENIVYPQANSKIGTLENLNFENLATELAEYVRQHIELSAKMDNRTLKKWMAALLGTDTQTVQKAKLSHKTTQEALEAALVQVIKSRVEKVASDSSLSSEEKRNKIFEDLRRIYDLQPNLNVRSDLSIMNQAYSTPAPLAFLAVDALGINASDVVLEPTAGTGMLLMPITQTKKIIANEIESRRRAALEMQGYKTTDDDAAIQQALDAAITESGMGRPTVVVANPPFGKFGEQKTRIMRGVGGKTYSIPVTDIDHMISWNSLETMPDDGRAVLILGAEREEGIRKGNKLAFLHNLFNQYNVVSIYEVDGKLYRKQGAGWPVMVITINGRRKIDKLSLDLIPKDVERAKTWDDVKRLADETRRRMGNESTDLDMRPADNPRAGETSDAGDGQGGTGDDVRGGNSSGSTGASGGGSRPAGRPGSAGRPSGSTGTSSGHADVNGGDARSPGNDTRTPSGNTAGGGRDGLGDRGNRPGGNDNAAGRPREPGQKPDLNPEKAALDAKIASIKARLKNALKGKAMSGVDPEILGITLELAVAYIESGVLKFKDFAREVKIATEELWSKAREYSFLAWNKIQMDPAYEHLGVEDVSATQAKKILAEIDAEDSTPDKNDKPNRPDAPPPAPEPKEVKNKLQVPNKPRSRLASGDNLVPVNLAEAFQDAFNAFEEKHGDIDEYVAKNLDYSSPEDMVDQQGRPIFSAEQVDALGLFFSAAEEGKGIVVADQTGVGKGRVAAGAIHYGVKNGLIPIFVTEKANLFTDIYRDLNAINQGGLRPFIINNDGGVMKDADGNIVYRHAKDSEFKAVMSRLENGDLSDFGPTGKYDYIAVTYSQFAGDKPHHKSKVKALTNMAGRALPIFDEAHNAAGDESWQNSNAMLMADHGNAGATLYLSATWAKRPENLKFFYRTDLGEGGSADDIQTALSHGGAVMQEMVTLSLAKSGQYLRREQSFDGIPFDEFKTADDSKKKDEEHDAEEVMTAIRAIVDFSSKVMQWVADTNGQIDTSNGPVTVSTNGVQHVAGTLSATEQFSIIHNYVAQFLAAMKSRSVAKRAIEHLREGKKVVIGVQNTMESMIDEMIAEDGFKIGEQFPSTYKNLLERVLQKCLVVKGTSPFGKNKRVSIKISLDDLGPVGKAEYYRTLDIIKGLEIAELPFSPIDAIRTDVEKAGFKTAEITGRDYRIDYSKPMPTLENREDSAKSKRTDIIRGFNSGNTDLVIINQAGATGVSMHAGRDFTDQRKRHMIILQSHPDIAVFMQMLGRIHRKGQIASVEAATSRIEEVSDVPAVYGLPSFELATSTLDMERRPAAVLKRKMKSLNAQTSSSQEGHQEIEGVDIINKYGDEIVFSWLHENPDIARAIGLGNLDSREDVARKATGRIAIMPIEVQKIFWQDVGTEYERRIAFLDEIGQNELNPVTVDAKATTIDRTKIYGEEGGSTFAQPVYLEYVEMRTNGKPTRLSEAYKSVVRLEQSVIDKQIQAAKKYIDEMEVKTKQDEALGKPTTFKPNIARTGLKRVENMIHSLKPGTIGFFRTGESDDLGIDIPAVITEVTMPTVKEGVHPFRPSDIMVKIKTADAKGKWTIPLSYLQSKFIMTPQSQKAKFESEYQKEYEASKVALERRYLLSGNLIMARTVFSGGGKVIRFSRADGQVDYAWLTPLSFKPQDNLVSPDVALRSEDEVAARYGQTVFDDSKNEVVITEDGLIKIRKGRIGNAILGDPEVRRILVGRTDVDIATAESDKFSIGTGMQLKSIKGKFFTLDFGREKTIEVMKKIFHILRRMGVGMKTFGGEKPNINNRPTGSVSTMPGSQRPSAGASAYDRLTGKPKNNTSFDVEAAIIRMFDDLDANMGGSKIKWDVRKSTASDPANSSGRFNPNTNTITIFTDRIDNEYELAMVLAHEVVGHAMFKELFGKHLASIASVIERTLPPRVVEDIRARYGARGENVVLHELVAALAERNMGEPTLWEKITAVFNRAMRALGITTEFSASEIKWMLADMKRKAFGTPSMADLAAKLRGKPEAKQAPRAKSLRDALNMLSGRPEEIIQGEMAEDILNSVRTLPPPRKTITAYKLFRVDKKHPGKLFPLFVNANDPLEIGVWLDAEVGPPAKGGKVKSKLGPLAYRPGWHAGDMPVATHIGLQDLSSSSSKPAFRNPNYVWAEVEIPADVDWQAEANRRGTNASGKLVPVKAHITDQIPADGHYRYKTNSNMTGNWIISGSMKIKRVLSDIEVNSINERDGVYDLPRQEPLNLADYGFGRGSKSGEAYDIILPRDRGTDPDDGPGKGRRQTETPEFDPDTNDTLDSLKSTLSPEERAVMGEQTQGRAFGEKDADEEPFVESAVKTIDSMLLKTGSELSRNRKVFEIAKQANPKNARSIEEWERIRQTMIRSQEADALDEQLAKHIRDDNFRAHAWVRGALGRLGESISEEMRDWVMRKTRRVLMPFLMKDSHERLMARIAERMYWNGTAMVPTPGFRTQTVDGAYHYREDKITADMAQAAFDALPQQWKDLLTERAKENEEYRQHFVTVAIPAKLAEASMVVVRDSMRLMGKADQKAIDRFAKALSAVYGMDESDLESVGITEDKLTVWKAVLEEAQKGGGKAAKLDAATAEIMRKKLGEAEKLIRGLETDRGHYGYMHRTGFEARVDPKMLDEANEFIHPWFVNIAASEKKRAGGAGYVENLFVADLAERRGRIEADENNAWMRRIEDMAQPIDYEDAEGKIQRIQDQDELDDVSGAPGEFDIRHLVKAKFGKYAGRMVFIPAEAYDRYKAILEPASADYQIKEVKGLMDAFNRWVNLINLTLLSYPAKMMRDLGAAPFHVVDFIVHWGISHPEDIQHMPDMLWNSFKTMFKPEAWNRMRKERLGEYSESLGFLNEEDKKHYITEALDGIGSKWGNLPIGSVISAIIGEVDMAGAGDIPIKRFFLTMGDQLAARRKLDGADRERFIRRVVSEYGFETSDLTPLLNYLRGKDPNATSKALGTIQKATLPFFGYAFTLAKRMLIDPVNKGALGRGEKLEGFDETTGKSRWATGLRPMFWLAVAYAVSKGILGNDDEDEGAALALSGRPNLKAEVRSAGRVLLSKDENPDGGEYYMSVKGYAHPSMAKVVYDWAHGRAHLGDIWTEMSTVHPVAQMVAGLFGLESAYSRGEDMGARLGRFTALAALPQFTRVGQDLAKVWRLVSGDDSIPDTKKASFLQAFGQFFGISEIPAQLDTDHEKRKMNPVLEAVKALGVNVKYIPYSAIADEANREAKGIEDAADRLKKLKEWQKNSNFRVSRKQTGPADEQEVLSRLGLRSYGSVQEAIDHLEREVAGERMSGLKKALQNLPIGSEKRVDPELRKYMKK